MGENLYAVYSIEYKRIEEHYFIFAARQMDKCLSWEEVKFYASIFDFPRVPELVLSLAILENIPFRNSCIMFSNTSAKVM